LIPVNRPFIDNTDVEAVSKALDDTYISGETPLTADLESLMCQIVKTEHAIAVSNGTVALDLLVEALDVKKGDHCIVPNFTIISTISNLLRKGANIELIDADPVTWSINADAAAASIRSYTKLILPVHVYGLPVDLDPILSVTKKFETIVIEDSAEALGVDYKNNPCGSFGHASTFSFYANKIVTGGEGGAITTNDIHLSKKLKKMRNLSHSSERFVHEDLGWNSRIHGLSAALIVSQLKRLETLKSQKRNIAQQYLQGLEGHPWITFMPKEISYSENLYWVFPILLNSESNLDAPKLQGKLMELGIETRRFFCPMNLQPIIKSLNVVVNSKYNVSENLWKNGIYLPSGLGTTKNEIEYCIETLWDLIK
jgi:perosamine synthetase